MSGAESEYAVVMDSPVGKLGMRLQDECLAGVDFLSPRAALKPAGSRSAAQVARWFEHYFQGKRQLPEPLMNEAGTAFQQRVRDALLAIPTGETCTYGELATLLGSGARAVGHACRCNPLPIIVPCHRVVGTHSLGGYVGQTRGQALERKRWLLGHEGVALGA